LEPDETFKVRISGGGVPITDNEAVGTILNDDAPPIPRCTSIMRPWPRATRARSC
jgi:hypothetical protein